MIIYTAQESRKVQLWLQTMAFSTTNQHYVLNQRQPLE